MISFTKNSVNTFTNSSTCDISETPVYKIATRFIHVSHPLQFVILVAILICYYSKNTLNKHENLPFPQVTWIKHAPLILNGWCTMKQLGKVGMNLFTTCTLNHGSTFYLPFGPLNVLATSDPTIIQKLLSSTSPTHLKKSSYIYKRLFVQELHDGLFVSTPTVWLPHRKCLSRGFVYKSVMSSVSMLNTHSERLINDITQYVDSRPTFCDGDQFAKLLGLNLPRITCDLVTGPGSYTDHDVDQIHQSIETHKECLLHVFQHPHLFIRPFWRFHPKKKTSDAVTETMVSAMRRMINYKTTLTNDSEEYSDTDFVPLIHLMIQENWTEKEILDNFATLIFAEHEATFASIQFTLLHLSKNPHHQQKCRKEIDTIFSTHPTLTIPNLPQLKHLDLCIKESLRLTPPVPVFARRITSSLKIHDNLTIPANNTIMIMPWVLHRNPTYYPNPHAFDPDRFVSDTRTNAFTYLPFSAGRRNCIAWKLSIVQLKVMVAWILRHFTISSTDTFDDLTLYYAVRVVPERNVNIRFTKRHDI